MSGRPELRQHLLFIADLSAGLQEIQERSALSAEARGRCARWRERATELEAFLKNRPGVAMPVDAGDLADLPPELLSELSGSHADPLEAQIMAVLRDCGGPADLDQLLIGLYRKFETVQKRRFLRTSCGGWCARVVFTRPARRAACSRWQPTRSAAARRGAADELCFALCPRAQRRR